MRFLHLIFIFLIHSGVCSALNSGPQLLRVCYDDNTKTATLYWKTPLDICSSFNKYCIYSNEYGLTWKLQSVITNKAVAEYAIPGITDIDALFKIVTYSACNGIDSFISDILTIDKTGPDYPGLDSVSFDQTSQNLIAGWKQNPSKDTKGYWVYKSSNSVNSKIGETDQTSIILSAYNKSNPANISMAAYDSCNNFSAISASQTAAYLSGAIDSCKREIYLSWVKYSGWPNINQYLIANINSTGFTKHKSLLSTDISSVISGITLGDSLCYYVRTEDLNTKKTSSSNTVCFKTRKLILPKQSYVSNVSVENDSYINISYSGDIYSDTDSLLLQNTSFTNSAFQTSKRLKYNKLTSDIQIKDLVTDFNKGYQSYRFVTIDKCNNITSASNMGTNIFIQKPMLKNTSYEFNWNPYSGWEKGINNQLIEISNDRFTWNTYKNISAGVSSFSYSPEFSESDSLCFRISAFENINSYGRSSISISNVQCIFAISDFYLPATLNPNSNNNTFKIYGLGLDKSRGKMEIFNRWGEKVFETNNPDLGWDARINNEIAPQGSYLYKVYFYDLMNRYYVKSGIILVLR